MRRTGELNEFLRRSEQLVRTEELVRGNEELVMRSE